MGPSRRDPLTSGSTNGSAEPDLRLQSRIPRDTPHASLVDYLARRFPYLDRAGWLAEIAAGRLSIDDRRADAGTTVRGGERLTYLRVHREPEVDRAFRVLHADAHVVVVDKPAHLPSHSDGPFRRNTLIHLVQERLGDPQLRLVHRLDRETSGVCVLARSEVARAYVADQLANGEAQKSYVAIVRGRMATSSLSIELPIGYAADSSIALRRSALPSAREPKPARTDVEVLRIAAGSTMVRCTPRTGRTHQIRVHLEAVGHPILGDKLYGRPDADYLAFVRRVKAGASPAEVPAGEPGRQLLHAERLSFLHPGTGRAASFDAPTPAEFAAWLSPPDRCSS